MALRASQVLILAILLLISNPGYCRDSFDLVLHGGRVMDPESGLDAILNVGINAGKITALSAEPLAGAVLIDVSGLVVAPGFIDLHAHGQDNRSNEFQARDGVTTALDLEAGAYPVDKLYANRRGHALLHYGVASGHVAARIYVSNGIEPGHASTLQIYMPWHVKPLAALYRFFGGLDRIQAKLRENLTAAQLEELLQVIDQDLDTGGIGIGFGLDYSPGANDDEIRRVFALAAQHGVPCFVHMRLPSNPDDLSMMESLLGYAKSTGAALHIVHITSVGLSRTTHYLEMIAAARAAGMDITVEAYPYTAASTGIKTAIFDPGWQQRLGITYGDLQWVETGERLSKESFTSYRQSGGKLIIHLMNPELVKQAIADPQVMIASDGSLMLKGGEHPRGAGTFARVLGYYSRELGVISLMDALRKMTIMPAQRLQAFVPAMRNKGRIRVGADADITIFNPATVIDRATYENSHQYSAGITHVMVAGTFVVRDSELVAGVYPGQAIRASR